MSIPATSPAKLKRFTVLGVCVITVLLLMPYLVGKPDGDKAPDIVRFIGRFHPLVLHLPIGVVALALLQEGVALFSRGRIKTGAGELMLGFAAASSVVAVIFGFLLYQGGGWEESQLAQRHMWGGIFFACAMIATFLLKVWSQSNQSHDGRRAWIPGAALFASSALMGLASHDGGSLTHGENYLVETAPAPIRKMLGVKESSQSGDAAHATGGSLDQQVVYTAVVAPLMEKRCNVCHNADKAKGKLRLDTLEWMVKGGKGGPAVVPGDLQKSLLLSCIALPKDDKKHMPPAEKPQIEAHELAVLQWWVANGADAKKTVAEMKPTDEIKAALAKLTGDAVAPAKPVKVIALDDALKAKVADVAKAIPGALTFECQQSGALVFSAVAMRKTLGDPEFQKLTPVLKQLVAVDLTSTKVTDRGVATLSGAENLRMVRLGETGVTDAALDTLGKLKSLESVSLYGTSVTDAGVNKLAGLSNLKHLYLAGTKVTPNALTELKKKLPQCQIESGI